MVLIILKAAPDLDLYVGWSTNGEAPKRWGTRTEFLAWLQADTPADAPTMMAPERRLQRADRTGTSAAGPFAVFGRWDDEYLIYEQRGLLPRSRLADACNALGAGDESAVWDMLEPLEDGVAVRRGDPTLKRARRRGAR